MKTALDHAEGKAVSVINMKVGLLSCVDPVALKNCFDMVKEHYAQLISTDLKIDVCFPQGQCQACGQTFIMRKMAQACPCGSTSYELSGGEELTVMSLQCA